MTKIDDRAAVTIYLKWAVVLVGLLISTASSAGVMIYQLRELGQKVEALEAQQKASERAIIETVTTLKVSGVIK